jgi:hypothetical protein
MTKMLEITNHGPLITATNYWRTEAERAGKLYCSVNAGTLRLLLPRTQFDLVGECRTSEYVIVSRGPWPEMGITEAVELIFEDHTDSPFVLHLSASSFDSLPGEPKAGEEWLLSMWVLKKDKPHKALERPCKWRRVKKIPDLSEWRD